MISEVLLLQYFKDLAETSVDIAHKDGKKSFFVLRGFDLDEFEAALKSMANKRGLIVQVGEGSFGSNDNVQDHPEITLFFVVHTDGKYEHFDEARDLAKKIAGKFLAKMRYDLMSKFQRDDNTDGFLHQHKIKFDHSGRYRNLGNLGEDERWTGKMVDLAFSGNGDNNLVYRPEDWRVA